MLPTCFRLTQAVVHIFLGPFQTEKLCSSFGKLSVISTHTTQNLGQSQLVQVGSGTTSIRIPWNTTKCRCQGLLPQML